MITKATTIARFNHAPRKHGLSYCGKSSVPSGFIFFVNALNRAKFSFSTQRGIKRFVAMLTFINRPTFFALSLIVTFSTAIFSFVSSAANMLERLFAYFTFSNNNNTSSKSHAFSATIFCNIFSVIFYIKYFFAIYTSNAYSFSRSNFSRRINHAS